VSQASNSPTADVYRSIRRCDNQPLFFSQSQRPDIAASGDPQGISRMHHSGAKNVYETGGGIRQLISLRDPEMRSLVLRPVLVFIPGGGFVEGTGNSPYYDDQVIAEQSREIGISEVFVEGMKR
jgi:hypothetical protein